MDQSTMPADSTVRSQDSANSSDSKETKVSKISESTRSSKDSKPDSCLESKHSKDVLIDPGRNGHHHVSQRQHHHHHHPQQHPEHAQQQHQQRVNQEPKDDFNVLMFTSCGQLLLGVVLVVFGVLVLLHGASLGGSGAGLWAGAGALVAGALGVVATLATSGSSRSGFSSAHLASSLIALALSNMAAITALTAVIRDSQRTPPDVTLLSLPDDERIEEGWAGLLASIGLLVGSVAELFVSGYTCVTLAPKLCDCLRPEDDGFEEITVDGKTLKTRNMVQQWVIAQNHVPSKNQPIYVVQPMVPVHPAIMQPPYGMQPAPGKYAAGFLPPGATSPGACVPIHVAYPTSRPPSQIMRKHHQKKRRASSDQSDGGHDAHHLYHHRQRRSSSNSQQNPHSSSSPESRNSSGGRKPAMASIGEDQLQKDLARTYTGLDKRISEEFISIAMDPERKSKASSHHGSDVAAMSNK